MEERAKTFAERDKKESESVLAHRFIGGEEVYIDVTKLPKICLTESKRVHRVASDRY